MAENIIDTLMDELSRNIQRETTATLERFKEHSVKIVEKHLINVSKNSVKMACDRFKAIGKWPKPTRKPNVGTSKKATKRKPKERVNENAEQSKRRKSNESNSDTDQNANAGPSGSNGNGAPKRVDNRTLSTIGTAQNIMNEEVNRLKEQVEGLMQNTHNQTEEATNQSELNASQIENDANNQLQRPRIGISQGLYKGPLRRRFTYEASPRDGPPIEERRYQENLARNLYGQGMVTNRRETHAIYRLPLREKSYNIESPRMEVSQAETVCLYSGPPRGESTYDIESPADGSPIKELQHQKKLAKHLYGAGMVTNRRKTHAIYRGPPRGESTYDKESPRMEVSQAETICVYSGPPRGRLTYVASPDDGSPIKELRHQKKLAKNLYVKGIPRDLGITDQYKVFLELCEKINVTIRRSDIENISQKDKGLIVRLHRMDVKNLIMSQVHGKSVQSTELFQSVKGKTPWEIQVIEHMTPFYTKLWFTALKLKNQQLLHSCKLTEDGLEVKRTQNDNERVVWSEEQLLELTNK